MSNLKLGLIPNEKPVKLTVELPAAVHRDLVAYGDLLARETGQAVEPAKVIAPMLARFMATDRAFAKLRKAGLTPASALSSEQLGAQPPPTEPRSESV